MELDWDELNRLFNEMIFNDIDGALEGLMRAFSHLHHMPEMVSMFLAGIQLWTRAYIGVMPRNPPPPGTSDAVPDIRLTGSMSPAEREEQRMFFKTLYNPSDPAKMKRLKEIIIAYKDYFINLHRRTSGQSGEEIRPGCSHWLTTAERSDAGEPGCSHWPTTAERSDAGEPGCSHWQTSAEQSGTSKPECSTRQSSAEQSGTSKPECSTRQSSAEQSGTSKPECSTRQSPAKQSGTSKPGFSTRQSSQQSTTTKNGYSTRQSPAKQSGKSKLGSSTRQTSAEREAPASWHFFRQELPNLGAEPSARVDDRDESSFRPLGEERLIDSLEHASRSEPSPGREDEEYGSEVSSERWGGPIQRVESSDSSRSPSLRPDSRPPPEVSLSSNLRINPNDITLEGRKRWLKHQEECREEYRRLDETMKEVEARWEEDKRQRLEEEERRLREEETRTSLTFEEKVAAILAPLREARRELAANQPGPSGLRRSSRLRAQKRKTQVPKGLSEGSDPKARRDSSSDSSD